MYCGNKKIYQFGIKKHFETLFTEYLNRVILKLYAFAMLPLVFGLFNTISSVFTC